MHPTRRVTLILLCACLALGLWGCGGAPAAFAQLATRPAHEAPSAPSLEEELSVTWGDWRHITYLPGGYPNDRVDVNLKLDAEGVCSYYVYNMEADWEVAYHGDFTVVEMTPMGLGPGLQLALEKYAGTGQGEDTPEQVNCLISFALDGDMPWYAAVTVEEGDALPFGMEAGDTLAMTRMVWPERPTASSPDL